MWTSLGRLEMLSGRAEVAGRTSCSTDDTCRVSDRARACVHVCTGACNERCQGEQPGCACTKICPLPNLHLDIRSFLRRVRDILMFERVKIIHLYGPVVAPYHPAPAFLSNHAVACSTKYLHHICSDQRGRPITLRGYSSPSIQQLALRGITLREATIRSLFYESLGALPLVEGGGAKHSPPRH